MSLLATHYENNGSYTKASFWDKMGVANNNPTSLLSRGLEFLIKERDKPFLYDKGLKLVIFAHLLGENYAKEALDSFNISLEQVNQIHVGSFDEISDCIREVEADETTST